MITEAKQAEEVVDSGAADEVLLARALLRDPHWALAAAHEARAFGVGAGMPLPTVARKCPDAVFLPVDKPAYDAASAVVMDTLRSFDVPVEVLGWDEAFMAVETDDPEAFADAVRSAVLDATRLHCSVGIGDNKLQAKIATDFGKPQGVGWLTGDDWAAVMGPRPTTASWGIGR